MEGTIRRGRRLALAFFTALAMVVALAPVVGAQADPDTECGGVHDEFAWNKFQIDNATGAIVESEFESGATDGLTDPGQIINLSHTPTDDHFLTYTYSNTDTDNWLIFRIVMKPGGQDAISEVINSPPQSGTLEAPDKISHITFCLVPAPDEPEPEGTVTVTKVVEGPGPAEADYTIEIRDSEDSTVATFNLADGESDSATLPLGNYTVVETEDNGADSVTIDPDAFTLEEDGQTVEVTVTNTFDEPEPGALTVLIDKTNDANEDGTFTNEETATVPAEVEGLVADVDFRAVITNTSDVSVTITELTDSFGTTTINICPSLVGTTLSPGESVVCDFTVDDYTPVSNGSTTNTASVTVVDGEQREASDDDDSIVHFVKVAATPISLTVVKTNDADEDGTFTNEETASVPADQATLSADVTFRAVITNDGTQDVVLTSITDTFGTTTISVCDSLIGTVLAAGASVTCTFTVQDYAPASGASQVNTVLVEGVDPQVSDNTAAAQDTSTVNFARVLQTEETTTTPATLPFTGGDGPTGALGALAAALVALGGLILAMARGRERRHRRRVS